MSTHLWFEIPTKDVGDSALGTGEAWMETFWKPIHSFPSRSYTFFFFLPESRWVISWTPGFLMPAMGGCITAPQTGRCFHEAACEKTQSDDSILGNQGQYRTAATKPWCEKASQATRTQLISTQHSILAPSCPVSSGTPTADISVIQIPPGCELESKLPTHSFHGALLSQTASFYATNHLD